MQDFTEKYYVMELGREVIGAGGFAVNDVQPPTVSLCWGMVRKDHLGAGFGKHLTEFRIKAALRSHGNLPLVISTSQHTQGFYEISINQA